MNILFLINYAGKAGTEKYVDNLQRIFSAGGDSIFFAYNVDGQLSETMKKRKVPCLQLDLTRSALKSSGKLLARYCRENKVDVIHAQFPVENLIAIESLKHYPVPKVVFTSHLSDKQGFKWQILNRLNTPKNHCVICVCDEGRENLLASGIADSKMKVIYNGIEPSEKRRSNKVEGEFKMLLLARFAREKGLDFLVEALAMLKQKTDKAFSCTICGEGELFSDIRRLAEEKGVSENLITPGFTTETEKYLWDSNLYLNTSRSGEAMSFAILEAMNAGLPVVATDVGGNKRLTDNIFEFGDVEGFADCIAEYMNNPEKLEADSLAAQEKIKKEFDLNTLAAKVREAYL